MITIYFADKEKWPLSVEDLSKWVGLPDPGEVKAVALTGEALLLVAKEFRNLPMPGYINEYQDSTILWYWGDAQFIVANILAAYEINKAATRGK